MSNYVWLEEKEKEIIKGQILFHCINEIMTDLIFMYMKSASV